MRAVKGTLLRLKVNAAWQRLIVAKLLVNMPAAWLIVARRGFYKQIQKCYNFFGINSKNVATFSELQRSCYAVMIT